MCKSSADLEAHNNDGSKMGYATAVPTRHDDDQKYDTGTSDEFTINAFELDTDQKEQHEEVIAHDEASGVVVFGSFVAGSLVGIVVCGPGFVMLLSGAGAAALCKSDSKVCGSVPSRAVTMT